MKRHHLPEIEDSSLCPHFIRQYITDYCMFVIDEFEIHTPAYQKIIKVLEANHSNTIIDVCSGSAGPIYHLLDYAKMHGTPDLQVHLTDLYPNLEAFQKIKKNYPANISFDERPVNASQLPPDLKGMVTLFTGFHHLRPDEARIFLKNVTFKGYPIGIFEFTENSFRAHFLLSIVLSLRSFLLYPFSKKITWNNLILTYLIPIGALAGFWDGIASNVRTYSVQELKEMVASIDSPNYKWDIGKVWSKKSLCNITYLVGQKIDSTTQSTTGAPNE